MSFDGVFINHLIKELKDQIIGQRINKILFLNDTDYIFSLSRRIQLLITVNGNNPHMRITKEDYIQSTITNSLSINFKKYFESSIISDLYQIRNDRIVVLQVISHDELGYENKYQLILEFFGRNSNLIITNSNNIIIDCFKKTFLLENNDKRIVIPKAKYEYPISDKLDPFEENTLNDTNIYEGVSNILFSEMIYQNNINIIENKTNPVLIINGYKNYFYAFDLSNIKGDRKYFDSLSDLLEYFYITTKNYTIHNNEQKLIEDYIKREINKNKQKLTKQLDELKQANINLKYEQIGNLLSANLHKVSKNSKYIIVNNFYNDNEEITIDLDPLLSPSQNLNHIFNKYKKSKRAIEHLNEQIENTKNDIVYYECLQEQLQISKNLDLKEIISELNISSKLPKNRKKTKPNITIYNDLLDNVIYVGKNNIQNNYLTHTLANKNDYFFHVKNIPGSHTILRVKEINDDVVYLAGAIAAYHSKAKNSSNVGVDYTKVKNVKKVPKMKGSFVTYTNYKTVYVTPSIDYIKNNTKN